MTDKLIVPGTKIRRKQHKQKNRPSTHPILTVVKFYHSGCMDMVEIRETDGKVFYMSKAGLEWYEIVK